MSQRTEIKASHGFLAFRWSASRGEFRRLLPPLRTRNNCTSPSCLDHTRAQTGFRFCCCRYDIVF